MENIIESLIVDLQNEVRAVGDKDMDEQIALNKRLIERYPFLRLRSPYRPDVVCDHHATWLDQMPRGWRYAFGIRMCEELRDAIIQLDPDALNTYKIYQIKEKYGTLHWYDVGYGEATDDILIKYEDISQYTCISCGRINVPVFDDGWVSPYCMDCFIEHFERNRHKCLTPEEARRYIAEEPNMKRDAVITYCANGGERKHRIDFSTTLRALGIDPDRLPSVDDIMAKRDI